MNRNSHGDKRIGNERNGKWDIENKCAIKDTSTGKGN